MLQIQKPKLKGMNNDETHIDSSSDHATAPSQCRPCADRNGNFPGYTFYTYDEVNSNASLVTALTTVQLAILLMPDYPAVPDPKTGLVSGSSSGTKCVFKVYDDGYDRCVSVYNSQTEELYSTIFIASGKTATVKIPQGTYYFIIGAGKIWYGEDHLFGDFGGYSKTGDRSIAGSKYYHTFTLNAKREGTNTEAYEPGDYSDVFGN